MRPIEICVSGDTVVSLYPRNCFEVHEKDLIKNIPDINGDIISSFIEWAENSDFVVRYHPFEYEYEFSIEPQDSKYMERLEIPEKFRVFFTAAIKHAKKLFEEEGRTSYSLGFFFTKDFLTKYQVEG